MKKVLFFSKFVVCFLLSAYSVLAIIYLFAAFGFLLGVMMGRISDSNSGSSFENSISWFFHNPEFLIVFVVMIIPGIVVMAWDDIVKGYKEWKERRNSLYLKDCH
ncbi:MAG: hypothetical protein WCJ57_03305 [Candidatus Falkowbacteria bacterium]